MLKVGDEETMVPRLLALEANTGTTIIRSRVDGGAVDT